MIMGITGRRTIEICARKEQVFDYIDAMPMKFPTLKVLDTRPFLLLRISLVGAHGAGFRAAFDKGYRNRITEKGSAHSGPGTSFGPFMLAEIARPNRIVFAIDS